MSTKSGDQIVSIVFESGFETDTGGFTARGGSEEISLTNEAAHSGHYSLKVENRSRNWHGPSLQIQEYITAGNEYYLSLWVKLIAPASAQIQVSTQIGEGSAASYHTIQNKALKQEDDWVHFEGTYRYNGSTEYITLYVESPNDAEASFYIDDVRIEERVRKAAALQNLNPLKSRYENQFLMGNIVSGSDLQGIRFDLLQKHFNAATAENAMKPSSLQHDKGIFTFEDADALVNAVLAKGMKMHGHTLAWHQQSPDWMNYEGISREEAIANLTGHAGTVAAHFKGKLISWDVLNEAVNDNPSNPSNWKGALRQSLWYKAIGPEYVELVFLAAREADPEVKLYYNDYNLDNQNKSIAVYTMVKELNEKYPNVKGRPLIDGIGMQGHYRLNTNPQNVALSIERFSSLGLEVSITELDVQAGADSQLTEKDALAQGLVYAALFTVFKTHAITRVTFWGLDDGTSWRSETNPTLFDKNLQAKPAFYAVENPDTFMAEHKTTAAQDAKQSSARYGTPVIDGRIDPVWNTAPEIPVNQYLMAWQGASGTAKMLWDDTSLYVLVQVQGAELNKASKNAHEQDSVEVFIDENNGKTSYFEADDGQYRVNFANEATFNPSSIGTGFVSAVAVSGKSYTLEMKIPFKTITPRNDTRIGFDVQINGASVQGVRQSIAIWNDVSGNSYQDTSGYGVLQLTGKP